MKGVHRMGVFSWPIRISSLDGDGPINVDAMVDTGATYTVLPAPLLRDLGIEPTTRAGIELADGRIVELDIGRAWLTIDGQSEITLVVFGDDDAPALLGAYSLEGLRLAVDPVGHRLISTNAILYQLATTVTKEER